MPWRATVVAATPLIALAITQAPIDTTPTDNGVSASTPDSTQDHTESGEHASTNR